MDDLISRAAAIEICKSIVPNTNPDFYNLRSKAGYGSWMHSNGEVCATTNIEVEIEKLPAVDAVPVVHGKWIWMSSTYDRSPCEARYMCSKCRHETITHSIPPWEKYFPNCGAKMDGDA